jgi:HSP20 family protein
MQLELQVSVGETSSYHLEATMLLTTFDPFSRDFDRIIDRAFGPAWRSASAMPMDAVRTEDGLVLRFDLPGIDPASIDVTVDRGVLTVGAKRTEEHTEGEKAVVRERITGTFSGAAG